MPNDVTMSRWPAVRTALLAAALLLGVVTPSRAWAQLRVIVPREYRANDISLTELTRLFRGDYAQTPTGERVVLVDQGSARTTYARVLLGMSEDQFRRHWIRVVFAGQPVSPPRSFATLDQVTAFVARTSGAVAVVSGAPGDGVKVLTVNGLAPTASEYPLR